KRRRRLRPESRRERSRRVWLRRLDPVRPGFRPSIFVCLVVGISACDALPRDGSRGRGAAAEAPAADVSASMPSDADQPTNGAVRLGETLLDEFEPADLRDGDIVFQVSN